MRSLIQTLFILLLGSTLMSCANHPVAQRGIPLAGGLTYHLQPPPPRLKGQGRLEQLQVDSPSGQKQLLLQSEFDGIKLSMVGLDPSGLVLFELSWQALDDYQLQRQFLMERFQIEPILAYYQLSSWPAETVNQGLRGGHLQENQEGRRLYQDQTLIFSLYEEAGIKHFLHHQDNYRIAITPLRTWQLDE